MLTTDHNVRTLISHAVTRPSTSPNWAQLIKTYVGGRNVEALGPEDGFVGRLSTWKMGPLGFVMVNIRGVPMRAQPAPTPRVAPRQRDLWLGLCLAGTVELEYPHFSGTVHPGCFAILDDSMRRITTFSNDCDALWIRVPQAHVMATRTLSERMIIDASEGSAAVAKDLLCSVAVQADKLHPASIEGMVDGVLKIISATFCPLLSDLTTGSAHRANGLRRAKQYIEERLNDESLSLQGVAEALALSPRYLNKLFESEQTSLMRWTWQRRLERARMLLDNPAADDQLISSVAYNFGFKNVSHFSRVFRERFGMSPTEYRGLHCRPALTRH
ncbi:MAG: helix-turn-helix domain-containing protein [Gammaproteobacteria bacterium]|nr:helix-turn-helix domain-containing protein [Gammaproteobacteria bacterium]